MYYNGIRYFKKLKAELPIAKPYMKVANVEEILNYSGNTKLDCQ